MAPGPWSTVSLPARAFEKDAESARAEYGGEFRVDLVSFVDAATLDAAVPRGVVVRAPLPEITYCGFVDPSGGSADAFTMAIAHAEEGGSIVLDFVAERKAPLSPAAVVAEFAGLLRQYRLLKVQGDRYAGEWPREAFASHGIAYEVAALNRNELYLATLPLLNSGRAQLLDIPRMVAQFLALERRTSRGQGHR